MAEAHVAELRRQSARRPPREARQKPKPPERPVTRTAWELHWLRWLRAR